VLTGSSTAGGYGKPVATKGGSTTKRQMVGNTGGGAAAGSKYGTAVPSNNSKVSTDLGTVSEQ